MKEKELNKEEKKEMDLTNARVFEKEIQTFGNSAHIIINKKYVGADAFVVVFEDSRKISVFPEEQKKIKGKIHYRAEVYDMAGNHSFWIDKTTADKMHKENFVKTR